MTHSPAPTTQAARSVAEACTSCGACRRHCPVLERYGPPARFLSGPDAERAAYACALCGLCRQVCPSGLDAVAAVREVRRQAYAARRHPARRWAGRLLYEALGRSQVLRAWALPQGADTVLFPGCALPGVRPGAVGPLWRELGGALPGRPLGLVLDCCAALSRNVGDEDAFRASSAALFRGLAARGVRRVLAACPSCLTTLREAAGGLEVTSAYEVLAEARGEPGPTTRRLTLHDPCATREEPGLHEAVRRLARSAGVAVVEAAHSREHTLCCGGGEGVGLSGLPDRARRLEAGDQGLFTYCAGCTGALSRRGPAFHLVDLLYPAQAPSATPGLLRQLWSRWRLARRVRGGRPV